MRIAVVAHSATRVGGVETYLADVIPALTSRGHAVACWFETATAGAEPIVAPTHTGPVWVGSTDSSDGLRLLRDWRPEVVYVHGLRSVDVESELTRLGPVVFFAHSYYGSCISGEKSTSLPVVTPCHRSFGPACLMRYFPRRCGGLNPITMLRQYGAQRHKQRLLHEYHTVLVASRHMAREYVAQGVRARVIALPAAGAETAKRQNRHGRSTLLYLGRLERSKGVRVALQAAAQAASALGEPIHLVVAGHGTLAAQLHRDAAELMARTPGFTVEFPGWLPATARTTALAGADLLLMPSVWPEPFGLAGVEAALAGVPAIAFGVGGIEDWLDDRISGRAVPLKGDRVGAFADAIVETLRNRAELDSMRQQAIAKARTFTMAAHVNALESVLRDAADAAEVCCV